MRAASLKSPGSGPAPLILLGIMLSNPCRAEGMATGSDVHLPRNVIHADVLAEIAGEPMFGAYYERSLHKGGHAALVVGASFAKDLSMGTSGGADVSEVESDLVGIGAQWRYYRRAPEGFYTLVSLSLVGGEAVGEDDGARRRDYTLAGYDVSILGFGYQLLIFDRLSLEAAASLRTSLAWLWERGGGDHGMASGFGIGASGGVGLAF